MPFYPPFTIFEMVLLFSSSNDGSTDVVIDWIDYLGGTSMRINTDKLSPEDIVSLRISNNMKEHSSPNNGFPQQANSVWFRRPTTNIFRGEVQMPATVDRTTARIANKHLEFEAENLTNYIYYLYNAAKNVLGNPFLSSVNKLEILSKASEHGLRIPETIITTRKSELVKFKSLCGNVITKAVCETPTFNPEGKLYIIYTEEVTGSIIEKCPDAFFPSLFQEKLDKEVELRVFYLDGHCYSAAIFSQNDEQTSVDFRRYNTQKPNRKVPFALPVSIEKRLSALMQDIGLNTGSIDLILTRQGEYVFLEINPVGQYGMVSQYCNAILSKEIAKFLLKNDYET